MLLIVALCQVSYAAIGDVFSDDVLTYKIIGVDEVEVSKPVNENCTEIAVPSSVIDNGVTYRVTAIGKKAFYHCSSLVLVTLPEGLATIRDWAFYECYSLASITFPKGLTTIGEYAFEHCYSLTSITLPEGLTTIGYQAFTYCVSLVSVTFPETLTIIDDFAFDGCESLISVTLPASLISIGADAFDGCIYNHRTTKTNQKYPSVNL